MRNSILAVFVLFALAGCKQLPPRQETEPPILVSDNFIEFAETIFTQRPKNPRKESIKKVQNAHVEDAIDQWHICEYDGYTVIYCDPGAADQNILSILTMTKEPVSLPNGIKFGQSTTQVISQLGNPSNSSTDQIKYEHSTPGYSRTATFYFKNGLLSKIEWEFEID